MMPSRLIVNCLGIMSLLVWTGCSERSADKRARQFTLSSLVTDGNLEDRPAFQGANPRLVVVRFDKRILERQETGFIDLTSQTRSEERRAAKALYVQGRHYVVWGRTTSVLDYLGAFAEAILALDGNDVVRSLCGVDARDLDYFVEAASHLKAREVAKADPNLPDMLYLEFWMSASVQMTAPSLTVIVSSLRLDGNSLYYVRGPGLPEQAKIVKASLEPARRGLSVWEADRWGTRPGRFPSIQFGARAGARWKRLRTGAGDIIGLGFDTLANGDEGFLARREDFFLGADLGIVGWLNCAPQVGDPRVEYMVVDYVFTQ